MKYLMRPTSEYLDQASLKELNHDSREWLSEIPFWQDEVKFLLNLSSKNMLEFVQEEHVERAGKVFQTLNAWQDEVLPGLKQKVTQHELHLGALLENPFEQDTTAYRVEHGLILDEIMKFMQKFKELKSEIFRVTEKILDEFRGKHLLG
ncbi:MAG: hypothetical protein H6581_08860 [Bacteroidia bacterium]|nr:hypothetical protein [Bacteroidia bacterium]